MSVVEGAAMRLYVARNLLSFSDPLRSPGAMVVAEGKILAVGSPEELRQRYAEAQVEDWGEATLLPGLVDAHTDLSLTLLDKNDFPFSRTEQGRVLLMNWLVQLSRYKANLTISEQQKAVQQGLQRQRAAGITTVGDLCRYGSVMSLYEQSGLRLVCLAEIENIQRNRAQEEFEQALALVDEIIYQEHPRMTAGLAPFSAYTLSKNLLKIVADHARQQNLPFHLVAGLSFSEMEFFFDSLGEITEVLFREAGWADKIPYPHRMTPIQYLHEMALLKLRPVLVGGLHLGPTDIALVKNHGAMLLWSPCAFRERQLGEIPLKKVLQEGITFAFGTLGRAWGGGADLWEELRCLLSSLPEDQRSGMAEVLLRAATWGGAKALGLADRIGSLAPGKDADFIVVASETGPETLCREIVDTGGSETLLAAYRQGQRL